MNKERYPYMNEDTKKIIKILAAALVLGALLLFISWLTAPASGAQPVTRTLDMKLVRASGLIFNFANPSSPFATGTWRESGLPNQRTRGGRVRIIETVTGGGEHLLFALFQGPPTRGEEEGRIIAATAFPGSVWEPLSGNATLVELGEGDYRIIVKVALIQSASQKGYERWITQLGKR